jgi:hypothetical protein
MSVKCGNRKAHNGTTGYHESAGEVRACYGGRLAQESVAAQAAWARQNFSPEWHAKHGLVAPVAEIQKGMEVEFTSEVQWLSCGPVPVGKRGTVRTHGSGHSTVEIFMNDRYHYVSTADTNLRPVPESQQFTLTEERSFDDVYAEHEARQERAAYESKMARDDAMLQAGMQDATDDCGRERRGALRMPTEPMLELIRKLREERGLDPLKFSGTFRQARVEIDRLKALPRVKGTSGAAPVKYPHVDEGRYAIERDGVVKFYRVNRVERRNEPGRFMTYLDVQASDDWHAIKGASSKLEILTAIAVDPKAAMLRYGHEIGSCGKCGRTLTDEDSRARGIGPICAGKLGW